jgi:hypothetical protein
MPLRERRKRADVCESERRRRKAGTLQKRYWQREGGGEGKSACMCVYERERERDCA